MIVDDFGRLVWFNAIGNRELATRLPRADLPGQAGADLVAGPADRRRGPRRGRDLRRRTTGPSRRVRAGNGFGADLHEFELTPQGTALLLIYDAVRATCARRRRQAA